jgi:hypothetical protein
MEDYSKNPIKAGFQIIGDMLYLALYHVEASIRYVGDWLSMKIRKYKLTLACIIGFVLFCVFVWPTAYRFDHIQVSVGRTFPVRINRFTGSTEILYPSGWTRVKEPQSEKAYSPFLPTEDELSSDELAKLEIRGALEDWVEREGSWGMIRFDVYNGLPNVTVKEITVEISVVNSKQNKLVERRQYRIRGYYPVSQEAPISPLQTGAFATQLGFDVAHDDPWSFRVLSAKGVKR